MDWKKEFLDLYSEDTPESIANALALKREHLPQKLYRYRAITSQNLEARKREITMGEIYLSRPADFNVPFEGCSILHSTDPTPYMNKALFEDTFLKNDSSKELRSIFNSKEWFDGLVDSIVRTQIPNKDPLTAATAVKKYIMSHFETINSDIGGMTRNFNRIACFSTKPNNLPMWHHYANAHTGVCLEYNPHSIENDYTLDRLFPVHYVERLPDMTLSLSQHLQRTFTSTDLLSIHKLLDWSYEDEWRLIYNIPFWFHDPEKIPLDFWKEGKPVFFALPSRILLGKDILNIHEVLIRTWANSVNIEVLKAQCTEYGLEFF